MDLGVPLVEYGFVGADAVRERMLALPKEFWEIDSKSRTKLAGNRPGNAVFFYNDAPFGIRRNMAAEIATGFLSVRRYQDRPLFAEVSELIATSLQPKFPQCDVMRVQLAELPPGDVIKPHRDVGILSVIHRLHVPIVTDEGVHFMIAGKDFFLAEGELYDLNNAVIHSVENRSNVMRVHLLVDMLPHRVARARYFDNEEEMVAATAPFPPKAN
jgi:hypothetical protein